MARTRVHDVEEALATLRALQRDLENVRKDFMVDAQPDLPSDVTTFHLRRQLAELERHIRDTARSAFSDSASEYQEVQAFGRLGPGSRDMADYFRLLEHLVFGLEQERLRLMVADGDQVVTGLDPLTDFYSRDLLLRLLEQDIAWAARKGETIGLILVRVADWSTVSCAVTPATRKEVIIALASILKTTIRPYDLVCRTGEAEFGVVLREADAVGASTVTKRIGQAFQHVMPQIMHEASIRLELATSTYPFDAEHASDLLSRVQRSWAQG